MRCPKTHLDVIVVPGTPYAVATQPTDCVLDATIGDQMQCTATFKPVGDVCCAIDLVETPTFESSSSSEED